MRLGLFGGRQPAATLPPPHAARVVRPSRSRSARGGLFLDTSGFLRTLAIQGRFERLAHISLIVLGVLAILFVMYAAKSFLLPTAMGIVIAFMGTPVASRLERIGVPRYVSAALIVLSLIAGAFALALAFAPSLQEWIQRIPEITTRLKAELSGLRNVMSAVESASREVQNTVNASKPAGQQAVVIDNGSGLLSTLVFTVPTFLAQTLYMLMLTFFLLAERKSVRAVAVRMPRTFAMRLRVARVVAAMRDNVARYLFTIGIINIVLGGVAGVLLYALGVPNAGLWGVGVGVMNFIPFIGPFCMQLVVFIICYVSFDSLTDAIIPPLCLVVLNFLEGNIITPAIVGQRMRLRPLAVFVAISFGAWIWGIGGAFVSVPVTILLWTVFQGLYRPVAPAATLGDAKAAVAVVPLAAAEPPAAEAPTDSIPATH